MTITQESSAPLFAVVGSTGAQGTSVIRAIKEDAGKAYRVRAVTRDPSSDTARERASWGCEVSAADVTDVESLKRAFAGAEFAFAMTNPAFQPGAADPVEKEFTEGKARLPSRRASFDKFRQTLYLVGTPGACICSETMRGAT